ncbi:LCP family protein required for cell wall assembly [Agromyces cerinus]|uniref:LCP family protein n=1 Tax=Agromyces cerinus TaxID=33878 RepID=UPI0027DB60C0|nr:LCP family protein [Agromyces cerinus]MBM7832106.1 LCP family protein required for cell wall assembly [Agromyces cerinus]
MAEELRSSARRAASSTPVVRHGRLKRRSIWRTLAKVTATFVAVALVSGVSVAAYAAWDLANTAKPSVTLGNEDMLEGVPDVGAIDGGVNLLLIGSDSREGQGDGFGDPDEETAVLNDVTMLLHISEDHTNASVISFPRDMLVDVPACVDPADPAGDPLYEQYGVKMNSVLSLGGMPCVVKTVEQLVGVPILFAGTVQFLGVAGLSEAVGGVPVCIAEPIEDEHTDLYLPAGMQELSGMQALQFLRTRHGVGDGSDLGRISNQQVFMSALARTLQSNGTLSDPVKLYGIAKAALANMELSDSLMDPTTMISIASALKDTDLSKIAFVQYPTGYSDGDLIPSDSAEIVNTALQNDLPVAFDPEADEAAFASAGDPTAVDAAPEAEAPVEEEAPAEGADATTPPAPTAEALPSDVTGQTAAETRCSAGRTLEDQ